MSTTPRGRDRRWAEPSRDNRGLVDGSAGLRPVADPVELLPLLDPTYPGLHQAVISGFCGTERHDEAMAALVGANVEYPEDPLILAETAYCYAVAGDLARARTLMAELQVMQESSYVSPVSNAMIHVGLGENEAAIDALERGVRERAFLTPFLAIDKTWDPLRTNPRFAGLIDLIGLSQ